MSKGKGGSMKTGSEELGSSEWAWRHVDGMNWVICKSLTWHKNTWNDRDIAFHGVE